MAPAPLDPPAAPQPLRKAPLLTSYVIVWTMFGALSFGYLAILALAPDWVEDLTPSIAEPQGNQGQRASARLAADVEALRESVSQLQLDVAKVKTELAAESERGRATQVNLAGIEARLPPPAPQQASAPTAEIAPEPAPVADPQPAVVTTAPDTIRQAPAAAAKKPKAAPPAAAGTPSEPAVINAEVTATALETGSVAPASAKAAADASGFGTVVVKPAPKPFGLRISTGASVDSLRLDWNALAASNGETLKNLEPRYSVSGDPANPAYELMAGPVKSKTEAIKACRALAANNVPCKVGEFTGNAL